MYYILKQNYTDQSLEIIPASHFQNSLSMGRKMPSDFVEPLLYEIDTEGIGEEDHDDNVNNKKKTFPSTFLPEPLFSINLVETLLAFGVDNIDVYQTVIMNPETGEEFRNYRGVNIVGVVSCADFSESKYEDLAESYVFRNLVISPDKISGFDIFRLAEDDETVLVSDRLKDLLEVKFTDLAFQTVEETLTKFQ